MDEQKPPLTWSDLTMESSREDVLAVLEHEDRRLRAVQGTIESELPASDGAPGCHWNANRTIVACNFGPRRVDPSLARQQLAGEEDQSVPGWDSGA